MNLSILLVVFFAICIINIVYSLLILPFTFKKNTIINEETKDTLTVLIYIKNDAHILRDFIERIKSLQSFEKHQFLFINHASHDDSEEILEHFDIKYQNVTLVNVENKESFWGSKRYALTLGIKQAINKKLIFISPNTFFEDNEWLSKTSSNLESSYSIGYNNFTKEKGFLNKIIRYYSLHQEIYHLGLGTLGKVAIYNDTNIGLTETLFFENSGFNKRINEHVGVHSLLYKDIGKTNTTNTTKATSVRQGYTWKSWKTIQKDRRQTYAKSGFATKFLFTIFQISQYLFWPLFVIGCIFTPNPLFFTFASISIILKSTISIKNGIDFNEKDTLYLYPFIELVSLLLGLYLFLSHLFIKKS